MDEREADLLARFYVESDAIEGISNTIDDVRRLLEIDEPWRRGHVSGHLLALLILRTRVREGVIPEEGLVLATQQLIVGDQHLKGVHKIPVEQRGVWRTHNMEFVSGTTGTRRRIGSDWQHVPADMAVWCTDACAADSARTKRSVRQVVVDIARLHWRYERIHPFVDGNGRSGRAMVYYQYLRAGIQPLVFTAHDRHERYYPCFQSAHPVKMERYFLDRTAEVRTAT